MFTTAEYNELIANEFNSIRDLVVKKNTDYDSAVFKPIGVFTSTTALEQIKTRLDDKLKRLQHFYHNDGSEGLHYDEDTEADVIAYLVLKRVLGRAEDARKAHVEHLREASGPIELRRSVIYDELPHEEIDMTPRRRRRKSTNGRRTRKTPARRKKGGRR